MTTVDITAERAAVVRTAMEFLGTPFHHGARIQGVGVDCAQLLIACYCAAGVADPPDVGEYSVDWFLHTDSNQLVDWVTRYCVVLPAEERPEPADVALFRYGRSVSHGAIVVDSNTVVHSFRGLGVILGSLDPTHDLAPRLSGFYRPRRWSIG